MNLLATVMPGVRDARTPLAVGGLWIAAAIAAVLPGWKSTVDSNTYLGLASEAWDHLLPTYQAVLAAFAAYLLGLAIGGLSAAYGRLVLHGFDLTARALLKIYVLRGSPRRKLRPRWASRAARVLDNSRAWSSTSGPLFDALLRRYSEAGLPPEASFALPDHLMDQKLQSTDLQLWHRAPEQYVEYDRLRAEADFRVGVALPLVVLGFALGANLWGFLAVLSISGSFVLVFKHRQLVNERRALLAAAIYDGLTQVPVLEATVRSLSAQNLPRDASHTMWLAATAAALRSVGEYEESEQCMWDMALEATFYGLDADAREALLAKSEEDVVEQAKLAMFDELDLLAKAGEPDLISAYVDAVKAHTGERRGRQSTRSD